MDNLDGTRVNGESNREAIYIKRESDTKIGRAFVSGNGDIQPFTFPNLCTAVDYSSPKCHFLGLVYGFCEYESQK
jgi:hypothetical protein